MNHIIVGVDFSECSRAALAQAIRLASVHGEPEIRAVHVIEKSSLEQLGTAMASQPGDARTVESKVTAHARFAIARMVEEVAGNGARVHIDVLVGHPADALVKAAKDADLLVIGSVGQAHPKASMGATATRCVRHAPKEVLVVRPARTGPFKRIIACVDFSDTSERALQEALRIARADGGEVRALHVFAPPPPAYPPGDVMGLWPIPAPDYGDLTDRLREAAEVALGDTVSRLGAAGSGVRVSTEVIEHPSYARAICEDAKAFAADLVVIGTLGRTNLRYMLMGSTAEKVVREVECSILAVRAVHG